MNRRVRVTAASLAFSFVVTGLHAWGAAGNLPVFSESLSQAELKANQNSAQLKASEEASLAARDAASASEAPLYPRLTLDGTYTYQTHVPSISLGGFGPPGGLTFGTNDSYNIGPTLTYTLFDGGSVRAIASAAEASAKSRQEDLQSDKRQLLLSLRLSYFQLQLGLRNLALVADSLKLSQAQNRDIQNRFKAGASSRLDAVNSRRQVLTNLLKFRQTQNEVAARFRDFLALSGETPGAAGARAADISRPIPAEIANRLPDDVEPPTIVLKTDAIEATLLVLSSKQYEKFDDQHPQLKSLGFASEAARNQAKANTSSLWPRILLSARAEYVYPDLVIPQTVEQNIFSVNLTMPLFEGSLNRRQSEEHLKEAMSKEFLLRQKLVDLRRDWEKEKDLLASLTSEMKISDENADRAAEAARLTYQSYKAGKQQYVDVERADVSELEARVSAAQVRSNILSAIAQLDYLSQ